MHAVARRDGLHKQPSTTALLSLNDLPRLRTWPSPLRHRKLHLQLERWHGALGGPFTLRHRGHDALVLGDAQALMALGGNAMEPDSWAPVRPDIDLQRELYSTMVGMAEAWLLRLQRASQRNEPVDMVEELRRWSMDLTLVRTLGANSFASARDADALRTALRRLDTSRPVWRCLSGWARRRDASAAAALRKLMDGPIQRARCARSNPNAQPRSLLEGLLREAPYDADALHALLVARLREYDDSSVSQIAWTLHYLALYPFWQERLHAHVRRVMGGASVCGERADLEHLDVLSACALEALRLRPLRPLLQRESPEGMAMAGVFIPPQTSVYLLTRPALRDARHFAHPNRFCPERWGRAGTPGGDRVDRSVIGDPVLLLLSLLVRHFRLAHAGIPAPDDKDAGRIPPRLFLHLIPREGGST